MVASPASQFHLVDLSGWTVQQLSYGARKREATDEQGNLSFLESHADFVSSQIPHSLCSPETFCKEPV